MLRAAAIVAALFAVLPAAAPASPEDDARAVRRLVRERSAIPFFRAVPGIAVDHVGLASDGGEVVAITRTSLGPGAVLLAYAKQLRAAGWRGWATATPGSVQIGAFEKRFDSAPYIAHLTVNATGATRVIAVVDLTPGRR